MIAMIKEKARGIELLKAHAVKSGYTLNRFGHYQKDKYRFKLQKNSVRYEVKTEYGWRMIMGALYSDLSVNPENGKLSGFQRGFVGDKIKKGDN